MTILIIKFSNFFLLLLSVVWLSRAPDWEPLIAFLTLLFGFIFQEYKDYKKYTLKDQSLEHDRSLFEKYDNILPEKDFLYVLNNDLFNLWIRYGFSKKFSYFFELSESIEGKYINREIQAVFDVFEKNFRSLASFVAVHFFVPKDSKANSADEWVLCLYPDLKYSEDPEKRERYENRQKELQNLIDIVIEKYTVYREKIKRELLL